MLLIFFPFNLAQTPIIYGQKKGTVLCNSKIALSAKIFIEEKEKLCPLLQHLYICNKTLIC
jgi:hypothetical protein